MAALFDSEATTAFARSLALVLVALVAYAAVWRLLDPGAYLLAILATYAVLGGVLLLQVARAVFMPSWRRRLAAVLTAPALVATVFAGLEPRPNCLDTLGCGRGLTFQPLWFAAFGAVTVALVAADLYWATCD